MKVLFCSNLLNNKEVDVDYLNEYNAVNEAGFDVGLMDFEELVTNNNPIAAIKKISYMPNKELALYRGWMMKPTDYEKLYNALLTKNIELINSPHSYKHCHYLPESYWLIKDYTPKTVWISKKDLNKRFDSIYELIREFGDSPVVIKDYVKSRKHEWSEACYIPNALDKDKVNKVVNRFLELQGDGLNEGIVFREFVKLEFLSYHPKSKMPLSKEFRVFFIDGEPAYIVNYWDEGEYGDLKPHVSSFLDIAKKIQSRFFTMDIAKIDHGSWIILELGDGQVSGLPDTADLKDFYCSIRDRAKIKGLKVTNEL